MSTTLVDVGTLKAWAAPAMDSAKDDVIQRCLDAAVSLVEARTGRTLEQSAYTEYFDGTLLFGALYLRRGRAPIIHTGTTTASTIVIEEDGVALTTAVGYTTTADVIIACANEDSPCSLVRRSGPWSRGVQNIKVSYLGGWTVSSVPAHVVQLILELAQLLFKTPDAIGKSSVNKAGAAVSFEKDLSEPAKASLAALTVVW